MIAASVPVKFQVPWASGASSPYVNPIPVTTATPGAASLTQGFPPITSQPEGSGGIPPAIGDENGILNLVSAAAQWAQAGMIYPWDSAFSTAIGGYPKGAVVPNSNSFGEFWINPTDGNTNNPNDLSSGDWLPYGAQFSPIANISVSWATGTISTTSSTFQSAGSTVSVSKKRASNSVVFIGIVNATNDVSSSPNGTNCGLRLAQNSSGSYTGFGNTIEIACKVTGQSVQWGGSGVSIFGETGTLPQDYNCQTQFNSQDGTLVHMTFSAIIAIEFWS